MTLTDWAISQAGTDKKYIFLFERTVRGKARADEAPEPNLSADEWQAKYDAFVEALD